MHVPNLPLAFNSQINKNPPSSAQGYAFEDERHGVSQFPATISTLKLMIEPFPSEYWQIWWMQSGTGKATPVVRYMQQKSLKG
jgi:hypothetical protein